MEGAAPAEHPFTRSLRHRLYAGFLNLPYIVICFVGFLAMGLGSIGLFVLFMGQVTIVPILVTILQAITDAIDGITGRSLFHMSAGDNPAVNRVIPAPADGNDNTGPTYWTAHMTFFFGYLLANAVSIKNIPADPLIDKKHTTNRMLRTTWIIIATILFALIFPLLRFRLTGGRFVDNSSLIGRLLGGVTGGAETLPGILLALLVCGGIGYAWYLFAESCGARSADVFGIAQQLLPSSAKDDTPMACVYSPKP